LPPACLRAQRITAFSTTLTVVAYYWKHHVEHRATPRASAPVGRLRCFAAGATALALPHCVGLDGRAWHLCYARHYRFSYGQTRHYTPGCGCVTSWLRAPAHCFCASFALLFP